ncbi:MAG: hypothetical protein MI863_00300 [Desulfobacterales bacterium]|nr:hypothetical protein [Desulfobacterales bacterium]
MNYIYLWVKSRARKGTPVLSTIASQFLRLKICYTYGVKNLFRTFKWYLSSSGSFINFVLTDPSKKYLMHELAKITGASYEECNRYYDELLNDKDLKYDIEQKIRNTSERYFYRPPIEYGGKRIAWYIITRIMKPRLIIESGIDRGVGTALISAALFKNRNEGHSGKVMGLDCNPLAGQLIPDRYSEQVEIVIGDSLESLKKIDGKIDVFIHDSFVHQLEEYETALSKSSDQALLVSGESRTTDCLFRFASENSLDFWIWHEEVKNSFITASGLGFARIRKGK